MKRRGEIAVVVLMFVLIVLILAFEAVYIYSVISHKDIKITGWLIGDDGEEYTLVTIYPEQEVGRVRDDFYGVNTHLAFLSNPIGVGSRKLIDIDNDGTTETPANYTWHRQKFLDAGMRNQRGDMYLSNYYTLLNNLGFERWINVTSAVINTSGSVIAIDWYNGAYNFGGTYAGNFSRSTDTHSGNYSMYVASNKSGGVAFIYRYIPLPANHTINFTFWIKSSNVTYAKAGWDDGLYRVCDLYTTGSGNWEQLNCSFNTNGNIYSGTLRFDVNADNDESFLIDDFQMYVDENKQNYVNKVSLENVTDLIDWAYANNQKVYIIADSASAIVTWTCYSKSLGYCSGDIDYDESYAPAVVDFLKIVTRNGLHASIVEVEITNEPYGYYNWFANISYDNVLGALEYMKLFNSTIKAIKDTYSEIKVGGPSGFRNAPILTQTFLSNMSLMNYPADFHSIHPYGYELTNNLEQYKDIMNYYKNCKLYHVECSHIVASEWSIGNTLMKNASDYTKRYKTSLGQSYISMLNYLPNFITSQIYQWSERYSYVNNSANYSEYPSKWHMVLDPQFNSIDAGELTSEYNVTKDFAHYHAAGNMIVNSSSNNNSIKSVASLNPQGIWHITVINTATNNINVNIDVSSTGVEAIKDLSNGKIYPVVNGIANVGVLTEYDVKHYEGVAFPEQPEIIPEIEEEEEVLDEEIELSEEEILIEDETGEIIEEIDIQDEVTQDNETEIIDETIETTEKTSKRRSIFKTIFLWDTGDSTNLNLVEENLTENKTESLGEIIIDYITGASSNDDNYSKDKKSSSSSSSTETSNDEEALLTEGIKSEVSDSTNTTYTLSQALSNKGYMSIIIILLGGIIVVGLIIKGIYKKKKHNADMIIKLNDWVKRAKALGYNYTKMKTLLEEKRWNSGLIERALEQNGVERESLY